MANTAGLKPKVRRLMNAFVAECAKQGITILVTQGVRTVAEQNALYALGRTKPGKIVTNAKGGTSFHNFNVAFDICFLINKKASYTGPWDKVGAIAEKLGLEWGGRWKGLVDKPHFQYTGGYTLADFQKGKIDEKKFA